MKTLVNKTILAVVATVLVAGTAFFTSCEKDETINREQIRTKSTTASENLHIGSVENGKITYSFNVEELSTVVYEQTGKYTVEKFEILDSILTGGIVEAYVVLYNVQDEVTESLWFTIDKNGNNYYMNASEGPDLGDRLLCVANPTCDKGCVRKRDTNGRFLGCVCEGEGSCAESEGVIAIIGAIVDGLERIFGLI
jgi:hypothetical protein